MKVKSRKKLLARAERFFDREKGYFAFRVEVGGMDWRILPVHGDVFLGICGDNRIEGTLTEVVHGIWRWKNGTV